MDEIATDKEYEERKETMRKMIGGVKGTIANKIKKSLAKPDNEKKAKCDLAYKVFHEGMELYEEGSMTFEEFVDDLHKTLLAIK